MDRFAAMLLLLGVFAVLVLLLLALFAVAPVICSCLISLLYSLYLFMAYEESGVHSAQEFENRFWTLFGLLLSTALFFAKDSPLAFGRYWSPSLGFFMVILSGYLMHIWDRHHHRLAISQQTSLRRTTTACTSLTTLNHLGIKVEDQLEKINECLRDIDQLLIPSTINNFINERFVLRKEREIISIFEDCDARALNYLVGHVKLALLFYKIKDHRSFAGQHRTQIIQLLAVDRLSILTVMSRVIVLHSLQLLKLKANPRAEQWVRNIILSTNQDDLSQLKTLMDSKGDYFCMTKLIYDDLRSETVRQDILKHISREAAVQQAHMQMGTKRSKVRKQLAWRKILSDVDDTLLSSGGSYPAGVDKRYAKKVVYPGVLAFYRELDLGTQGPDEWPENRVGNLVFLSARPHVYKDMSEKANFAKFEKLRATGDDGRKGLHTTPSLLAGDLASGASYIYSNDFEHLARKKFENFKRYVTIFPEYKHVFVADNGQGDVRAGSMIYDAFPYELEAMYVHVVQDRNKTHGYDPDAFRKKEFFPCYFTTYPEAALHAATIAKPPLISMKGLWRVCHDAVQDFRAIPDAKWASQRTKAERRMELNQAIWRVNFILEKEGLDPVPLIQAEELWKEGQKVRTPYGIGIIRSFDPIFNLYKVDLDWRPLNVQLAEHLTNERNETILPRVSTASSASKDHNESSNNKLQLETVVEIEEIDDDVYLLGQNRSNEHRLSANGSGKESSGTLNKVLAKLPDDPNNPDSAEAAGGDGGSSKDNSSVRRKLDDDEVKLLTTKAHMNEATESCNATAYVAGHLITKYTRPVLPKLDKTRGSIFTFWSPSTNSSAAKKTSFEVGAECTTPFGPATVVEHRKSQRIVVLDMVGWKARAYLREQDVKPASKGLIRSILRSLSKPEAAKSSLSKPKEFPYAEGTVIDTPFGKGCVSRPLPHPGPSAAARRESNPLPTVPEKTAIKEALESNRGGVASSADSSNARHTTDSSVSPEGSPTIGIILTSWTLADGKHPMLYCTVESAQTWKDKKEDGKGLLSTTLSLVSSSTKKMLGPFLSTNQKKKEGESPPKEEQYFKDSAAVTTKYGDGVVTAFRSEDGFYSVSLINWTLSDGSNPTAFLKKNDISCRVAKGCQEGYPVYTKLGLTGTLASVEPTTGVHIVTIASARMICYLRPEDVVRPLKAAVGEVVLTTYGEGVVERYRLEDSMYVIRLKGGRQDATLYGRAEAFDRASDGMQDRGSFGMKWLLDFFFSDSAKQPSRSRSNSVTSGTSRTSVGSRS